MVARGYDPPSPSAASTRSRASANTAFPESHAASFALLVYVSSWLKCHHPAVFCRALLNSQPMGFYAPAQIVRDAREHGVEVRPVDQLGRREALWSVRGEAAGPSLPLFAAADAAEQGAELPPALPAMPASEHVLQDYQTTRLSLKAHPVSFLRPAYGRLGMRPAAEATALRSGARVQVAGVVLVRQRPGTASGVCFITLEDETGVANLVVWPNVFERYRAAVMAARLLLVRGRVQRADNVTHIVASALIDRTSDLDGLSEEALRDPLKHALARADEAGSPSAAGRPASQGRHPRDVRIIPPSRDFH
jgi:error-prone DNA polymerase